MAVLAACSADDASQPARITQGVTLIDYCGLHVSGQARFSAECQPRLALDEVAFEAACWRTASGCAPLSADPDQPVRAGQTLVRLLGAPEPGPGRLEVTLKTGRWTVDATWSPSPAWRTQINALAAAGQTADALSALRAIQPAAADRDAHELEVCRLLARQQPIDAAVGCLRQSSARLAAAGWYSEATSRLLGAVFLELQRGGLAAAQQDLEAARALLHDRHDPVQAPALLYSQASISRRLSRFGTTARQLEEATRLWWAAGRDSDFNAVREATASFYADQGRYAEAVAIIEKLPLPDDPRSRLRRSVNAGWQRLNAMRACLLPRDFPRAAAESRSLAGRSAAEGAAFVANAWINAAYAAWLDGDGAQARADLATARATHPAGGYEPHFTAWLDASLILDAGDAPAAERAFGALAAAARETTGEADGEYVLRALHGLGAARLAQGDPAGALAQWRAAVAMLRRLGERSELLGGRSAYHAARDLLLDDLLRLLLDQGKLEEALRLADRARAPVLHDLAASAPLDALEGADLRRWTQLTRQYGAARDRAEAAEKRCRTLPAAEVAACKAEAARLAALADAQLEARYAWVAKARKGGTDALPRLPSRQALLAMIPLRQGRSCAVTWAGLLLSQAGIERVDLAQLRANPARLAAFEHLYVVDAGQSPARDLPEWPVGDAILAERLGISFIPRAAWLNQPTTPVGATTLAIADPELDLPHSRTTGQQVPADARLIGPKATREAVLRALDGVRWLHFDGHGDLGNGRPGDAHLRLAQGGKLTLHDILVRRPRIGTAILSGCEVGRSVALSAAEGVGLAEGFLLAGTDRVLAPDRVIPDDEAARFLRRFYAEGGMQDPVGALQTTTAALRAEGDEAWKGWRLFGRR